MKVGIIPVNIGVQNAQQVVQTAQFVESLGYESVWTFEHVIVPVNYLLYEDLKRLGRWLWHHEWPRRKPAGTESTS